MASVVLLALASALILVGIGVIPRRSAGRGANACFWSAFSVACLGFAGTLGLLIDVPRRFGLSAGWLEGIVWPRAGAGQFLSNEHLQQLAGPPGWAWIIPAAALVSAVACVALWLRFLRPPKA